MFTKLEEIEQRYEEIARDLASPEALADLKRYQSLARNYAELGEIVTAYRKFKKARLDLEEARELLQAGDPEMGVLAQEEVTRLEKELPRMEERLRLLLLPKDPDDAKDVIMEIRAGAGGDEAALFAGDLYRMYSKYAENRGWRVEVMDSHPTELGGFKEIIFSVQGRDAYSRLKYESGVHRVQRVPATESGGRIHTSTATVAVLPEAEEVEVEIAPEDLRIDVFCSSGPGGQSVNTTQSAVRITHLPSGMVVTCQDEKSQHKNKDRAMRVLRARLLEQAREEQANQTAQARRTQVGTGDRSERIRTYNFPQVRVTDHRIGLTLHKLDRVLEGELDEIIGALVREDQAEKLRKAE
ncbi:MAG: peptide chain release factor 1 [Clostridia bacterium]|nr:MAG: peptide chain release factor 1 [Clostridia bacterium]